MMILLNGSGMNSSAHLDLVMSFALTRYPRIKDHYYSRHAWVPFVLLVNDQEQGIGVDVRLKLEYDLPL